MSIELKDSAEAVAAIATVIMAADQVGNFSEKEHLFNAIKKLDIFRGYDASKFTRLLGHVTQKVYDGLPCENGVLTSEGFESLLGAAKKVLSVDQQKQTFELAVSLAAADGMAEEEALLIETIQKKFNIDTSAWKKAA